MAKWIWKKYETNSKIEYECVEKSDNSFLDYYGETINALYKSYKFNKDSGKIELIGDILNGRPAEDGESGWLKHYDGNYYFGTAYERDARYADYIKATKILKIYKNNVYSKGSFIEEVIADENAYANNQRNSDGYWYVRDRIANIFYNQNKAVNKFYSQSKNLKIHQEDKEW